MLLADFDWLFGQNFPQCRRDIRPFLELWAQHISLDKDPSDESGNEALNSKGVAHTTLDDPAPDDIAADEPAEGNTTVNNITVDGKAADDTAADTALDIADEFPLHNTDEIIRNIMPTSRIATPKEATLQDCPVLPAGPITATTPSPSTPVVVSNSQSVASTGVDSASRPDSSGWINQSSAGITTPLTALEDFIDVQARHMPPKRGASPGGRNPKVPRLSLTDELQAEFKANRHHLREELDAERHQLAKIHREAEKSRQSLKLLIKQQIASLNKE